MSLLNKGKQVCQWRSKSFTNVKYVCNVWRIYFGWDVAKVSSSECSFRNPPPEDCSDKPIHLLVGDGQSRHWPFAGQVTVELQRRQCNSFSGSISSSMSSNLVFMQTLHSRLLAFQLEICGCSASSLQVPLVIIQVNFCHDMLLLLRSFWVVRWRGRVHSGWCLLHIWGHSCRQGLLA